METNQATQAEVTEFLAQARAFELSAFDYFHATSTLADIAARIAANAAELESTEKRGTREHGRKFRA